jgi:hypothetical protein
VQGVSQTRLDVPLAGGIVDEGEAGDGEDEMVAHRVRVRLASLNAADMAMYLIAER